MLYWYKSTNTDANFAQWASDCYFGASALALQRLLAHFRYTLVAEDGKGTTLFFVRNDLLPAGGDKGGPAAGDVLSLLALLVQKYKYADTCGALGVGAHLPSLMSPNWLSKVLKAPQQRSALHAPCRRRVWVRVAEGGGLELDRVLVDHEPEVRSSCVSQISNSLHSLSRSLARALSLAVCLKKKTKT